jgi:integrase/recombinase XerD
MAVGELIRLGALNDPTRNLSAAIECFLTYCRAKNLSENTLVYYGYRLEAFRRYVEQQDSGLATAEITRPFIRDFVRSEIEARSPSTANHSVTALRAFFGFLAREGFLTDNPMIGVEKVRQKRALISTFATEQIEAMLASCGKDFLGVRDKALILMLFDMGLRVSELCGLKLADVSWSDQQVLVLGKGNRERTVGFGQASRQALAQYVARRGELKTDAAFVTCFGDPLNRHRAAEIVRKRCKMAGVTGLRCSPHTIRHTFAVSYLRGGGDLFSLQKILGHSDLTMTRRYCELSQTDVIERHRLHSPGDKLKLAEQASRRRRIG